jgi:hypothetical protein
MAKSKVTMTPDQISTKWGNRLKQSVQDIQRGIDAVSDSPMEKAAAAQDKMLQNLTAAIQNGSWANGLRKVSLTDWKNVTKTKIGSALPAGVDAAIPKRKAFDNYLVNTLNNVLPEIAAMPSMTIQDSVARVTRLMQHMHDNPYK